MLGGRGASVPVGEEKIVNDGVCAVAPGIDLGRHARLLSRVHDAVLADRSPPVPPRNQVARSWARLRALGVDPDRCDACAPAPLNQVEALRQASPLRQVIPELRGCLRSVADDPWHVMVLTDAQGVLLWSDGSRIKRRIAEAIGFTEGANWSERIVGTNAIGTALIEDVPVQLFSAEHYARRHHPYTCAASPIHDPRTGELIGAVDVTGPASTAHPATIALVCTAARLAESVLWRPHEERLDRLRTIGVPLLATFHEPAVVVDDQGWVAAARGIADLTRVAAPSATRMVSVPGLGICLPEPVLGGYLLRPDGKANHCTRLVLDLHSSPPQAIVETSGSWRHELSTRHAELLLLLTQAGAAGMGAAALSRALFGDGAHLVTVRAEVSRLRRKLGDLVSGAPYRIRPGVEVVLPDLSDCGFVRLSNAPGVCALAGSSS
jgi:hypothetical protein